MGKPMALFASQIRRIKDSTEFDALWARKSIHPRVNTWNSAKPLDRDQEFDGRGFRAVIIWQPVVTSRIFFPQGEVPTDGSD